MKNQVAKRRAPRARPGSSARTTPGPRDRRRARLPPSPRAPRRCGPRRRPRSVVDRDRAAGIVLRIDATAGEHPGAAGERELRVASQHERLEPVGSVSQEHDGRGRDRRRQLVVGHGADPTAPRDDPVFDVRGSASPAGRCCRFTPHHALGVADEARTVRVPRARVARRRHRVARRARRRGQGARRRPEPGADARAAAHPLRAHHRPQPGRRPARRRAHERHAHREVDDPPERGRARRMRPARPCRCSPRPSR